MTYSTIVKTIGIVFKYRYRVTYYSKILRNINAWRRFITIKTKVVKRCPLLLVLCLLCSIPLAWGKQFLRYAAPRAYTRRTLTASKLPSYQEDRFGDADDGRELLDIKLDEIRRVRSVQSQRAGRPLSGLRPCFCTWPWEVKTVHVTTIYLCQLEDAEHRSATS